MNDAQANLCRLERLQRLLALDPGNVPLRRQCIDLALSEGNYAAVLASAELALSGRPGDPQALFDRATGLIGLQRYGEALEVLLALKTDRSFGIDHNIALCHHRLGQFSCALPYLNYWYERGVREPRLLQLLVTAYHHLSRMDEAVQVCRDNEAPATENAVLAGAYALVFLDADDVGRAARWAATALRLNPDSVDGRLTEGTLLIARLEKDRARAMLASVIDDAPQTGRAWLGLGSLSLLERDLDSARRQLNRAVELMPQHLGSWQMLAWTQLMQQDIDAAEATFRHALEIDRTFAETHGGLASISALRGKDEEARDLIKVALRLDPECLSATFAESVLAYRGGSPERAQAIIEKTSAFLMKNQNSALSRLLTRHS
jgi:tetratricopeptide (TPR) repeat protein